MLYGCGEERYQHLSSFANTELKESESHTKSTFPGAPLPPAQSNRVSLLTKWVFVRNQQNSWANIQIQKDVRGGSSSEKWRLELEWAAQASGGFAIPGGV